MPKGCKKTHIFFLFPIKMAAMPYVWYAKCHEKAIVGVRKPPYLCTVIHSQREINRNKT